MNTLSSEQLSTLANETRRQNTALQTEQLKGQVNAFAVISQVIGSISQDVGRQLAAANQELMSLSIGAGPGITSNFGLKTDHLAAFVQEAVDKGIITDEATIESLKALAMGSYVSPVASNEATAPLPFPSDTEAPVPPPPAEV